VGTPPLQKRAHRDAPLQITSDGDLVIKTDGGELRFHKPVVYQPAINHGHRTSDSGLRTAVEGRYVLDAQNRVRFAVGPYDHTRPLVIDPVLTYSTYLGGSGADYGTGIAVDSSGNGYVCGYTTSVDFPTVGPIQGSNKSLGGVSTAFVSKLNATGSALIYSTYLGGTGNDQANGIAVDASGDVYVTGFTSSTNFPTAHALQASNAGSYDAFVAQLIPSGSALVYSTYLGGSLVDKGDAITFDASGNAYVTGYTLSTDFPTAHPYQTSLGGTGATNNFVAELNWSASTSTLSLVYSTYFGGNGVDRAFGIAVDSSGGVYVTGETYSENFPVLNAYQVDDHNDDGTGFVSKFSWTASTSTLNLVYSTYFGGTAYDTPSGIAVDASGSAYVVGTTGSADFPITTGAFDTNFLPSAAGTKAFVSKLSWSASDSTLSLAYSTYLGGSYAEYGYGIALDSSGNAYVTGYTESSDFPTVNAFQPICVACSDENPNAFVTELNSDGTHLIYSTYLGGSTLDRGAGIAVDSSGEAYVTGYASSSNFPTTSGVVQSSYAGDGDVFVTKFPSMASLAGVNLSASSLSFSNQVQNTTSSEQSVTLTSSGANSLIISSVTASGDFALTTTGTSCPYGGGTVASGSTCTLDVTFTPTTTGALTGTVTVNDNAAGSPQTVSLAGTGVLGAAVQLSPSTLTFPAQVVNTTSSQQTVTLTNPGTVTLTVASITVSGNFALATPALGTPCSYSGGSVSAGGSCVIAITFTPTSGGSLGGDITLTDNDNGVTGSTQTVGLSGTGQDFAVSVAASASSTQSVAPGGTATYGLSVTDLGGFSSTVSLSCGGAPTGAICTVTPNSVPTSSSPTPIAVTVTTTAAATGLPRLRTLPPAAPPLPWPKFGVLLVALLALVFRALSGNRQIHPRARIIPRTAGSAMWLALTAGLLLLLALAGCGGGSGGGGGGGGGGGSTSTPTPAGTYTLTVTGTTSSPALNHGVTLTLTVT
jgi:hypothetical protein